MEQHPFDGAETICIRTSPAQPITGWHTGDECRIAKLLHTLKGGSEMSLKQGLGKCDVKGCEREAVRVAVAIQNGEGLPAVVCQAHYDEGVANYQRLYPDAPKKRGRKAKRT